MKCPYFMSDNRFGPDSTRGKKARSGLDGVELATMAMLPKNVNDIDSHEQRMTAPLRTESE